MWTADKDADMKAIFLCSSENMAWKKIGLLQNLNPWPVLYRCIALSTELTTPLGAGHKGCDQSGWRSFLFWSDPQLISSPLWYYYFICYFFAFNRILCSCYSNIKFISSFRRVISSIYRLSGHSQIFPWREGAISDPACVPLTIALKSVSKWTVW